MYRYLLLQKAVIIIHLIDISPNEHVFKTNKAHYNLFKDYIYIYLYSEVVEFSEQLACLYTAIWRMILIDCVGKWSYFYRLYFLDCYWSKRDQSVIGWTGCLWLTAVSQSSINPLLPEFFFRRFSGHIPR